MELIYQLFNIDNAYTASAYLDDLHKELLAEEAKADAFEQANNMLLPSFHVMADPPEACSRATNEWAQKLCLAQYEAIVT
jgi:hypothetical protein